MSQNNKDKSFTVFSTDQRIYSPLCKILEIQFIRNIGKYIEISGESTKLKINKKTFWRHQIEEGVGHGTTIYIKKLKVGI